MTSAPFFPIIYVRGYAMTPEEIDETTADPFCGFNLGSTVFRASIDRDKPARKFVFESPLVRLSSDYGYRDVYENGYDILDPEWDRPNPSLVSQGSNAVSSPRRVRSLAARSVVICRYYDDASRLLGDGRPLPIDAFAKKLGELIHRVRELVCEDPDNATTPENFRCYLVAHSMGGLVCRALLQNPPREFEDCRGMVDKFFTYATPHNGIEMAGLNVPSWLSKWDMNNFSRERMKAYLGLPGGLPDADRVDYLPERMFPIQRCFCMIGSNRGDYEAAHSLSRTFAGHGSDGLVRIDNAGLYGLDDNNHVTAPAARAYAYRAHSGFFGIVNGEEAFRNLERFLFGDVRADVELEVTKAILPAGLEGKNVNALYQVEFTAQTLGMRGYLSRRIAEEDSVACRTHKELTDPASQDRRKIYLSTVFLSKRAKVKLESEDPSLTYSMLVRVRVPDYEVEKRFWPDEHHEGASLVEGTLFIRIVPSEDPEQATTVEFRWSNEKSGFQQGHLLPLNEGRLELVVPLPSSAATSPALEGNVRIRIQPWNAI